MSWPTFDLDKAMVGNENEFGHPEEMILPIGGATLDSGAPVPATASGAVGYGAVETSLKGLIWKATAATTDIVVWDFGTTSLFRPTGYGQPATLNGLQVLVLARRKDTTGSATEDTTLGLTADLRYYFPGLAAKGAWPARSADSALVTLTTKASAIPAAKSTTIAGFQWYTLDIGARLVAESKFIQDQCAGTIALSVTGTVGTALAIEVAAVRVRYVAFAAARNKAERDPTYTLNPS